MVLTALTWYIRKQFGDQQMQRWYRRCSDSAMAFIGINPVKRLAQRAFVQTESGDTFYCVWEFPDCPNHMCEGLCYCMSCEGYGAWGEYGPCNCIAYGDRYALPHFCEQSSLSFLIGTIIVMKTPMITDTRFTRYLYLSFGHI